MRKPIIAGNWKMHKTTAEARQLVYETRTDLAALTAVDVVLCPPFTALAEVAGLVADTPIRIGAQNAHWEPDGAYTGEISAGMLAEFCDYVILGHSERRAMFGETDEGVNRKVHAALGAGLIPIVCVGETFEENQADRTGEVVVRQVRAALAGLDADTVAGLVVAYEPVWAIGTGLAAEPDGAAAVIRDFIRGPVGEAFGSGAAETLRVQYGGSVKPDNAGAFFSMDDIDGALVGGASLKAADFIGIVRAAM
ncbi:MAG TPA: triose-phosphate isomerase [Anaerolineales bacterium]|nr:triose-phosphate isomerase [Anaerolineales bacterium]